MGQRFLQQSPGLGKTPLLLVQDAQVGEPGAFSPAVADFPSDGYGRLAKGTTFVKLPPGEVVAGHASQDGSLQPALAGLPGQLEGLFEEGVCPVHPSLLLVEPGQAGQDCRGARPVTVTPGDGQRTLVLQAGLVQPSGLAVHVTET